MTSDKSIINLTLNKEGYQKFVWLNQSGYKYDLFYTNDAYYKNQILVDSGNIERNNNLINASEVLINKTNLLTGQNKYRVDKIFLVETTNQTGENPNFYEIGYKTIISLNISLNLMTDNLSSVIVWYIDQSGMDNSSSNLLYSNDSYFHEKDEFLSFNLTGIKKAYGIRVVIEGNNNTMCNGTIKVSFKESNGKLIRANMSTLDIIVYDNSSHKPIPNVVLYITNNSESVVNLTTNEMGIALDNKGNGIPFWYLRGSYILRF